MSHHSARQLLFVLIAWTLVVILFASQWYAYDAAHSDSDPFVFYLGWSAYFWLLTPFVVRFAWRHPIDRETWKSAIALHLSASLLLTGTQVFLEALAGWLRHHLLFEEALRHYFSQHLQVCLVTYWVLVAGALFYRMYDQARARELHSARIEARLAEAQLDILRRQIQPHFLFNTLQAASVLIHDDPDGAEEILLRLSELLRVSLDQSQAQEVPLSQELEFLEYYMGIQRRRFGDRLRFELEIAQHALTCAVPPLVLQPLVENAIRHGIGKHKDNDVISVRAFTEQDRLHLEVRNLSSVLDDKPERLIGRGVGLANTQARLEQLYGPRQSMQLYNLEPRGVGVMISVPRRARKAEKRPVPLQEVAP